MEAFFKRRRDFVTYGHASPSRAEPVYGSIRDDKGVFVFPGQPVTFANTGDWLVYEGRIWLIAQVTPEAGETTVRTRDPLYAFERELEYEAPAEGTLAGAWIKAVLESEFRDCPDAAYAMPYLTVSNLDTQEFVAPEADDDGVYAFGDYLRTMAKTYDLRCSFTPGRDTLTVTIWQPVQIRHPVVFTDGHSKLETRSVSMDGVAKITTVQDGVKQDWYLGADGEVYMEPPADRASGTWLRLKVASNADPEEKARAKFAASSCSHKIEFYSDKSFELYDKLTVRVNGQVLHTYISYAGRKRGSGWTFYKTGELATTAAEILKEVKT